ncbi:hypothetical protein vBEcoMWL3_gp181 [Escherichia phage vB_EcoM_WL-3]|nr:hypothetical protein vBEcoMWL3_gp181 [Escherichia phage vB_EcoM_WL-3]
MSPSVYQRSSGASICVCNRFIWVGISVPQVHFQEFS